MINKKIFLQLLKDICSVTRYKYLIYLFFLTFTGLLEGFTLLSVIPLLVSIGIGQANDGGGDLVNNLIISIFSTFQIEATVTAFSSLLIIFLCISTVLFLIQAYLGILLQSYYVNWWQQRLVKAIFSAKWGLFVNTRNGDLINAVITESQRLGGAFYQTGLLVTGCIHGVIYLLLAVFLSGWITVFVFFGGGVLILLTTPIVKRAYKIGFGISYENTELQVKLGEFVASAKLLKSTATENIAIDKVSRIINKLREYYVNNAFDAQKVKAIFDFGAAFLVAIIIVLSKAVLNIDTAILLVILGIFIRLIPKLTGLQQSVQALTGCVSAIFNLKEIANKIESEHEKISFSELPASILYGPIGVNLQNIDVFHGDKKVLFDISINIQAGACVALLGKTGAGKSSLVDAILGLVPITAGSIVLNGIDILSLPLRDLRRRVGYMGQETMLYNASIRDNILWARPEASDEEVLAAANMAAIEKFISKTQGGLNMIIGDRGGRLSGGERQRLGLARALLVNPGLLILDEATSALDYETTGIILKTIKELKGKITIIIISHSLKSVEIVDYVYVLDKGRLVQSGTWPEIESSRVI